jgi:PhnB protein
MSEKRPAQVIPSIFVESVDKSRGFFIDQLGFEHTMGMVGKDGQLDFCIVARDGGMIMISRPPDGGPVHPSVEIYVEVGDVDAYHKQVGQQGVKVVDALTTQWWGDRNFSVQDPHGYKVWFYKTVKQWTPDMAPPPGVKLV